MKRYYGILAAAALAAGLTSTASAIIVDCSTFPSPGGTINGATYNAINPQSTGTGVLDPFLREQANGAQATTERGINSSSFIVADTKGDPHTHDLQFSFLQAIGGNYRFVLDVNQLQNAPISLTALSIYTGPLPGSANDLNNHVGMTLRYTMGVGNEVQVQSQNGSGSGDMEVLIPIANFAGASGYVFLDATFAAPPGTFGPNDGFEEWAANVGPNDTFLPDGGATIAMLGLALTGLGLVRRKIAKN